MSLILQVSPSLALTSGITGSEGKFPEPIALCTGNSSPFTANESPSIRSDCLLPEVVSLVQEVIAHFPEMIALLVLALLEPLAVLPEVAAL